MIPKHPRSGIAVFAALVVSSGCAGEDAGASNDDAGDVDVTGVYASSGDDGPIDRLLLAEGRYAMTSRACAGGVSRCVSQGAFELSADRARITLRDRDTGELRELPFSVAKSTGLRPTESGTLTTRGLCIVGGGPEYDGVRCPPRQDERIVTPQEQPIVVRCTGNCAVTVIVGGQPLTTTGDDLTIEVPRN